MPSVWYVGRANGTLEYTSEQFQNYATHTDTSTPAPAGPSWLSQVHPVDVERVSHNLSDVWTQGREVPIDFRLLRADGGYESASWLLAPLRTRHGLFARLIKTEASREVLA